MHGDGGGGGGHSGAGHGGHGRAAGHGHGSRSGNGDTGGFPVADPYSAAGRRKAGGGAVAARFVLGLVVLVAIAVVIIGMASKL